MSTNAIRFATATAVAAFALSGVLFTPTVASAQPVKPTGAKGCSVFHVSTGTSEEVADGTLIVAGSGSIYQCKNGEWVKVPERAAAVKARALGVTSARATVG